MTKKITFSWVFSLLFTCTIWGQEPANYYSTANGLSGYALKTELSQIISNGAIDLGYGGLWTTYTTSDIDYYYEKDGSILDIYSENPAGTDPYEYIPQTDQCGSYSSEGDCYNREHIVPQSLFNKESPMRNDAHFIVPTDGKVNGMRSNYPFGIVASASYTSQNGTKVGSSASATGYSGTVAEPIDEFKGDVARMVLYFVTRYESRLGDFSSGNMLQNNADGLTGWELNILLDWHFSDPVSQRELDRNNAIYDRQQNRNPYIDHPEFVKTIWGNPNGDTTPPSTPTNAVATVVGGKVSVSWDASTDNTAVTGYNIFVNGAKIATSSTNNATLRNYSNTNGLSITITAFDKALNYSTPSAPATLDNSGTDTQSPTAPANVQATNITTTTADISWDASTDNVGVTEYKIYLDNTPVGNATTTNYSLTNLTPNTNYSVQIEALDAAGNSSTKSTAISFTTATEANAGAAMEDFEALASTPGVNDSQYAARSWVNPDTSISWSATDSRIDIEIYPGSKALTLRNGNLISNNNIPNGIGSLTLTTMRKYGGTSGALDVYINNTKVGEIPYSDADVIATTTISNINIEGDFKIKIVNPVSGNRVAIDNLNWTSYTPLGTSETHPEKAYQIYPNPVTHGKIYIKGKNLAQISKAEIYTLSGTLVKSIHAPFKTTNYLTIQDLPKGIYLLKTDKFSQKFIVH